MVCTIALQNTATNVPAPSPHLKDLSCRRRSKGDEADASRRSEEEEEEANKRTRLTSADWIQLAKFIEPPLKSIVTSHPMSPSIIASTLSLQCILYQKQTLLKQYSYLRFFLFTSCSFHVHCLTYNRMVTVVDLVERGGGVRISLLYRYYQQYHCCRTRFSFQSSRLLVFNSFSVSPLIIFVNLKFNHINVTLFINSFTSTSLCIIQYLNVSPLILFYQINHINVTIFINSFTSPTSLCII